MSPKSFFEARRTGASKGLQGPPKASRGLHTSRSLQGAFRGLQRGGAEALKGLYRPQRAWALRPSPSRTRPQKRREEAPNRPEEARKRPGRGPEEALRRPRGQKKPREGPKEARGLLGGPSGLPQIAGGGVQGPPSGGL